MQIPLEHRRKLKDVCTKVEWIHLLIVVLKLTLAGADPAILKGVGGPGEERK